MAYTTRTAYTARPGTGRQTYYAQPGHVKLNGLEDLGAVRRAAPMRSRRLQGLGYPAYVTPAIAAQDNQRYMGAVRRAPIGGRYRLRGLGDCSVIDPVTGGRVSYPSGDPHCGPVTPPAGGGGGGTTGCSLTAPLCPSNLQLIGGECWAKDSRGNDIGIMPAMKTVPPPCSANTGAGAQCVYPDCSVLQFDANRYSKFYQPRFPLCSDPTLVPGQVCVDANGNTVSYQPPPPTCTAPQILDPTGRLCITPPPPAPQITPPPPAPTPTPAGLVCPAPLALDPTGTFCMQPAAVATTSSWTDSVSNFVAKVPGGWAGVGVGAVVLYMLFFKKGR